MRVLGVINQKGGCGKTTTAVNLAACLMEKDRRVLLVDMDPQGHATYALNASDASPARDLRSTLLNLYKEPISLSSVSIPLEPNLDLIPSLLSLVALEQELNNAMNRERRLRDLLEQGWHDYDYVLIDAPPNLGLLTINALTASKEILVPVDTGMFSLNGLRRLFHMVDMVQERMRITQKVHILLTFFNSRVRLSARILEELEEQFPENLLETRIRNNIHLKEAAGRGKPIIRHRSASLGSLDYRTLAEEILAQESLAVLGAREESRFESMEEAQPQHGCAMPVPGQEAEERSEVLFEVVAPKAQRVYVVGEFNDWELDATTRLDREEGGIWRRLVALNPGNYQYKYFIDGEWVIDPDNPLQIVNESGVVNSLVKVK